MPVLDEILSYNSDFVQSKQYVPYLSSKFPNEKLVVLSCMDTRLIELLPKAMNLKNGDAKLIKNAGAIVAHPFGSVMRSILVAIYELTAEEVCVVGHHGCGMSAIEPDRVLQSMMRRGISPDTLEILERSGHDMHKWLQPFSNVEDSVKNSVDVIKNHPLMPKDVPVHGLVIDPETGKLDVVVRGYDGDG